MSRRVLVLLQSFSIPQVADGGAKEKAIAEARAAKEKITASEQQQQLQEYQVVPRKLSTVCCPRLHVSIFMVSLDFVTGSRSSRCFSTSDIVEGFSHS